MPVFLDAPGEQVDSSAIAISGWIACNSPQPDVSVSVCGRPVPFTFVDRPDVRAALPAFLTIRGVTAVAHLDGVPPGRVVDVALRCDGETEARICRLEEPASPGEEAEQAGLREEARAWCLPRLCCSICGAAGKLLLHLKGLVRCQSCGTGYAQATAALNMIAADAGVCAGIVPTGNVSSNPYTPDALALIDAATSHGGWVLDCGAGSRPRRLPGVVNVEVADYRSTDVLAVGESLPFLDNSFEAVLSLAVLEHVRDPFACARELVRVLRPGGELLADVPFMQPVHGYPNHYYNMTPAGLQNLFAGLGEVVDCRVPPHGHPIFGVQRLLGAYLGALPAEARAQFAAMTVGEAAAIRPHEVLATPLAAMLDQDAQGAIGCLNTLRFRKVG